VGRQADEGKALEEMDTTLSLYLQGVFPYFSQIFVF
jgi:hypothetical protein